MKDQQQLQLLQFLFSFWNIKHFNNKTHKFCFVEQRKVNINKSSKANG